MKNREKATLGLSRYFMNSYESVCCFAVGHAGSRLAVYRVYDAAVSNDRTKPPGFSSRLPDAALIQLSVHAVCAALFLRVLGDCDEFLCGSL